MLKFLKNPHKIARKQALYDHVKNSLADYGLKGQNMNPGKINLYCEECGLQIIWTGSKKMSKNGPYVYMCLCHEYWVDDKGAGIISKCRA